MKLVPSTKLLLPCLQPLNSFQEFSRVAKIATDMKTPIDMKDMKIDTEEVLEVFRRFWKGWDRTSCPSSLSGQIVFLPCPPGTHPKVKKCRDFSPQKDDKFLIPPHQSLSPHALNTHGSALPALGLFFFFWRSFTFFNHFSPRGRTEANFKQTPSCDSTAFGISQPCSHSVKHRLFAEREQGLTIRGFA